MSISLGELESGIERVSTFHGKSRSDPIASWTSAFCKKQVIALLSRMQHGRLSLTMPDGQKLSFGTRDLPAPAEAENSNMTEAASKTAGVPFIEADLKINCDEFYVYVLKFGDIGLAEAYMDGLCESSSIRNLISWFLVNLENSPVLNESGAQSRLFNLFAAMNRLIHGARSNSIDNSKRNIRAHYDLGNEFFKLFLDRSMTYSSALFEDGRGFSLFEAQQAKYRRICEKLRLSREDHLLEIGCGWGGFSFFAASNYGCRITGITISEEQYKYARQMVRVNKLEHLIDLKLCDYRHIDGKYDKIASIEMIEAVGDEHMDTFIASCDRLLAPGGLLAFQMIVSPDSRYDTLRKNVDFIQKHIFPGSLLPSLRRVNRAMEKCGDLFLLDYFDMGSSYVETLRLWQLEFNKNAEVLLQMGFDECFIRKWNYYFEYCQAAFDMRNISVAQAVFTRPNNLSLRG